ncbi:MAG: hypothetical protein R2867_04085 [Caldilineaceae bacterium]
MAAEPNKVDSNSCTLIFWGNRFDESAAVILATTLRDAGLRVKIVGVGGPCATGQNGITLQADILISDVPKFLAETRCIVMPCYSCGYKQLENDPRIYELFVKISSKDVILVIPEELTTLRSWSRMPICSKSVETYSSSSSLLAFALKIAEKLSGRSLGADSGSGSASDQLLLNPVFDYSGT